MKNLILIAFTALFLFGCATVSRDQPNTTPIAQQCTESSSIKQMGNDKKWRTEKASSYYLPYAVAALNTYDEIAFKEENGKPEHIKNKNFTLEAYQDGWSHKGRMVKDSGLLADYYFKKQGDGRLEVLIAFRGSRFSSLGDWYSNLSPVLSWLPFRDHYDLARQSVAKILEEAQKQAQPHHISIITTGHSLGGGLAQHIAYAYPCTTAIVFNSSSVTNKGRLRNPYNPQIIHIRERGDELNAILGIILPQGKSSRYEEYKINLAPFHRVQHSSKQMSANMARMVADCSINTEYCPDFLHDEKARTLYCDSDYGSAEKDDPICKRTCPKKEEPEEREDPEEKEEPICKYEYPQKEEPEKPASAQP